MIAGIDLPLGFSQDLILFPIFDLRVKWRTHFCLLTGSANFFCGLGPGSLELPATFHPNSRMKSDEITLMILHPENQDVPPQRDHY